ncbi:hypothetical protein MCETE4_00063 [Acidimicrobiia bacterium]
MDQNVKKIVAVTGLLIAGSALIVLFGQLIYAFLGDWSDLGLKFRISAANQYPVVIGLVALLAAAMTADRSKVGSTITNVITAFIGFVMTICLFLAVIANLSELGSEESDRFSGFSNGQLWGDLFEHLGLLLAALVLVGASAFGIFRGANLSISRSAAPPPPPPPPAPFAG